MSSMLVAAEYEAHDKAATPSGIDLNTMSPDVCCTVFLMLQHLCCSQRKEKYDLYIKLFRCAKVLSINMVHHEDVVSKSRYISGILRYSCCPSTELK